MASRRASRGRNLAALLRAAQAANLAAHEAREAEERAAENAEQADQLGVPEWAELADIIEGNAPERDEPLTFDHVMMAAPELHRRARARRERVEADAQAAERAYFAALSRVSPRRPVPVRPARVLRRGPRRRAPRRAVRLSAVASAGSGADGPPPTPRARGPPASPPPSDGARVWRTYARRRNEKRPEESTPGVARLSCRFPGNAKSSLSAPVLIEEAQTPIGLGRGAPSVKWIFAPLRFAIRVFIGRGKMKDFLVNVASDVVSATLVILAPKVVRIVRRLRDRRKRARDEK